ncbi:MAG: metallophosphoesterase [Lachnospiraceae bacterium]|nr:metallophosphoesterase [Lachnospiraceae bacterium]
MKKFLKGIGIFVATIALVYLIVFVVNLIVASNLRTYIDTFDPVDYSANRIVPVKESDHYSITSDGDIKIMHITDIHIGGGFWSYKNDKKSIYEMISMMQVEKPDLVILGGDNTYCVPGPLYNGGFTFNNGNTAKTVLHIFEHEKVYFSTVFGNHDTESMDYYSRSAVGKIYMRPEYEYCIFEQEFEEASCPTIPSVTNQLIKLKNSDGSIRKLLILIDTNAYKSESFMDSVNWNYDIVHDEQIEWAKNEIIRLSEEEGLSKGTYLKSLLIGHIPIGEYRTAHDILIDTKLDADGNILSFERKPDQEDVYLVDGVWGEKDICIGGYKDDKTPNEKDNLFEVLTTELGSMELMLCGHDHLNNAAVYYKGAVLAYGYSVDNEAYGKTMREYGRQRGATVLTVTSDGSFKRELKNAYLDYGVDTEKFCHVILDADKNADEVRPK